MKILIGLTGSVATVLADKLVHAFYDVFGDVEVVASKNALKFLSRDMGYWTDEDEWKWDGGLAGDRKVWQKDDPVLHIELRKRASAFVIAPCSANKLAEMANGLCPDLLTSVALAWDYCRPMILAPAANSFMWQHPATQENVKKVASWGAQIIGPTSKLLACGDEGIGAMARIEDIVSATKESLRWQFPVLAGCSGIPISHHPGAFGFHRRHSHHTGVDLYCLDGAPVRAVETGRVINIEHFTGPQDESPWWNNTEAVLIQGPAGVVCYGEIEPISSLRIGDIVGKGKTFAQVKRVLREGKERPDIPGHNTSMLHLELYPHETTTCSKSWKLEDPGVTCRRPDNLLDPTQYLVDAKGAPERRLSM